MNEINIVTTWYLHLECTNGIAEFWGIYGRNFSKSSYNSRNCSKMASERFPFLGPASYL